MKVSELGEIRLVNFISGIIKDFSDQKAVPWQKLITGPGDDAASWRGDDLINLATVDSLIENVHYTRELLDWTSLGWKALAINLSDIAAMGGVPRYTLISLGLPPDTEIDNVTSFYRGMLELANQSGVAIVGGDTDCTPLISVSVTLFGVTDTPEHLLLRSSAKPGELVAVTGNPGNAGGGLRLLQKKKQELNDVEKILKQSFWRPVPRLFEGRLLVEAGIKTAIDISDGLIVDLERICQASHTGARIFVDDIPISPALKEVMGEESLEMSMAGGEDYELLFSGTREAIEHVKQMTKCPITIIGEMTFEEPGKVQLYRKNGEKFNISKSGWDHFSRWM